MTETNTDEHVHYTEQFTNWCELDFGEGFLSPGGSGEVAKILEGIDLTGKEVLDIGVGLAGPACVLVEELGAARVVGIDVEEPVLKRATAAVQSRGLSDRVILKRVDPGPLPFKDESFDVVFSKDAIIHIPDTDALFREIHRVLRPGGWAALSDWYCSDEPFTDAMSAWMERLDLGLAMKPLETDRARFRAAGFVEVETLDRNAWFHEYCKELARQVRGPKYETYVAVLGEKEFRDGLVSYEQLVTITSQGQLRPGHLRGRKAE